MKADVKAATKATAESTYTMTGNLEITTSCPTPEDPMETAIGYWVFVVDNHAGTATAIQPIGVCRYGNGYWNVAPDCPFEACIDAQCKECREWME